MGLIVDTVKEYFRIRKECPKKLKRKLFWLYFLDYLQSAIYSTFFLLPITRLFLLPYFRFSSAFIIHGSMLSEGIEKFGKNVVGNKTDSYLAIKKDHLVYIWSMDVEGKLGGPFISLSVLKPSHELIWAEKTQKAAQISTQVTEENKEPTQEIILPETTEPKQDQLKQ